MSDIVRRIEKQLGIPNLAEILSDDLEPSELHSLLMEVYRRRSERKKPFETLAEFTDNRLVQPALSDPRVLLEWDRIAYRSLPDGFDAVELSPLCPLGTCSTVATVSQDKSIVTSRNLEVLSDGTNALALECAVRRRELQRRNPKSAEVVRLATSHRLVRPQISNDPRMRPHFRLFHLATAGRDPGSRQFETTNLAEHVRFYLSALSEFLGTTEGLEVAVTDLSARHSLWRQQFWLDGALNEVRNSFPNVSFRLDDERHSGRGYYQYICFHINWIGSETPLQLADGGSVDWTEKLLSNAKEHLFISGIGSERVCGLKPSS